MPRTLVAFFCAATRMRELLRWLSLATFARCAPTVPFAKHAAADWLNRETQHVSGRPAAHKAQDHWVNCGATRFNEIVVSLCTDTVLISPNFFEAWGLLCPTDNLGAHFYNRYVISSGYRNLCRHKNTSRTAPRSNQVHRLFRTKTTVSFDRGQHRWDRSWRLAVRNAHHLRIGHSNTRVGRDIFRLRGIRIAPCLTHTWSSKSRPHSSRSPLRLNSLQIHYYRSACSTRRLIRLRKV